MAKGIDTIYDKSNNKITYDLGTAGGGTGDIAYLEGNILKKMTQTTLKSKLGVDTLSTTVNNHGTSITNLTNSLNSVPTYSTVNITTTINETSIKTVIHKFGRIAIATFNPEQTIFTWSGENLCYLNFNYAQFAPITNAEFYGPAIDEYNSGNYDIQMCLYIKQGKFYLASVIPMQQTSAHGTITYITQS